MIDVRKLINGDLCFLFKIYEYKYGWMMDKYGWMMYFFNCFLRI